MIEAHKLDQRYEWRLSKRDAAKILEEMCPRCYGELFSRERVDGVALHHCACGALYRTKTAFKEAW